MLELDGLDEEQDEAVPAFSASRLKLEGKRNEGLRETESQESESEESESDRALPPLRSEKLLQYSFLRFADTRPIVRPRLRTHFADILNSQLIYTVQLLIVGVKGGLTLILSFPKAWFLLP